MQIIRLLLFSFLLFFLSAFRHLMGQDFTKTETLILTIPQAISSITKELIKDKMVFTLKDAAGNASGVNDYSGYDEYTIRGFRAEAEPITM